MRTLFLIVIATLLIIQPGASFANFSGFVMTTTESPAESIEDIVDAVISGTKLEDQIILEGGNLRSLRKALIKGCNNDRDVLRSLVRLKNETLPSAKEMAFEQQESEYELNRSYLLTVAQEFGYRK